MLGLLLAFSVLRDIGLHLETVHVLCVPLVRGHLQELVVVLIVQLE